MSSALPFHIGDDDRKEISNQLLSLIAEMDARYTSPSSDGAFLGVGELFTLPSLGLTCFVRIGAMNCELYVVDAQAAAAQPDAYLPSLPDLARVQLLEPLVPPRLVTQSHVQTYHHRLAWLRKARTQLLDGTLGYDYEAAQHEAA